MPAVLISILGSVVVFLSLRKEFSWYQYALLVVFLVGLTLAGELDFVLPTLIVFAVLPYVASKAKYDLVPMLFLVISGAYLFVGLLFQSPTASLITFLSKLFQFIVFFIIIDNSRAMTPLKNGVKLVVLATLVESVIGLYLVRNGSFAFSTSSTAIRLVSNSQPITGNLAVALLPIIGYLHYACDLEWRDRAVLLFCVIVLCFWVILSGTRGYVIVFGTCALLLFVDTLIRRKSRMASSIVILAICMSSIACLVLIGVFQGRLLGWLSDVLRLSGSLGVRDQENLVLLHFFESQGIGGKLFGIGLGGDWSDYPGYVNAVITEWGGSSYAMRYLSRSGVVFHNFYGNILGLQGIIGVVAIISAFAYIESKVLKECKNGKLRLYLSAFLLMNALVLYYRWSADCGICEFAMLAYVLNLTKERSY